MTLSKEELELFLMGLLQDGTEVIEIHIYHTMKDEEEAVRIFFKDQEGNLVNLLDKRLIWAANVILVEVREEERKKEKKKAEKRLKKWKKEHPGEPMPLEF